MYSKFYSYFIWWVLSEEKKLILIAYLYLPKSAIFKGRPNLEIFGGNVHIMIPLLQTNTYVMHMYLDYTDAIMYLYLPTCTVAPPPLYLVWQKANLRVNVWNIFFVKVTRVAKMVNVTPEEINALIDEPKNDFDRLYRTWCVNNPDKVFLIRNIFG